MQGFSPVWHLCCCERCEGHSTFFTHIQLFTSMNSLMVSKLWTTNKGLSTFLTLIVFLTSVNSLMLSKFWVTNKSLSTFFTFKGMGKFFLTVGFQLINVGERTEFKNHHLATTTLIVASRKSYSWMIKSAGEVWWGINPQRLKVSPHKIFTYYKGMK